MLSLLVVLQVALQLRHIFYLLFVNFYHCIIFLELEDLLLAEVELLSEVAQFLLSAVILGLFLFIEVLISLGEGGDVHF